MKVYVEWDPEELELMQDFLLRAGARRFEEEYWNQRMPMHCDPQKFAEGYARQMLAACAEDVDLAKRLLRLAQDSEKRSTRNRVKKQEIARRIPRLRAEQELKGTQKEIVRSSAKWERVHLACRIPMVTLHRCPRRQKEEVMKVENGVVIFNAEEEALLQSYYTSVGEQCLRREEACAPRGEAKAIPLTEAERQEVEAERKRQLRVFVTDRMEKRRHWTEAMARTMLEMAAHQQEQAERDAQLFRDWDIIIADMGRNPTGGKRETVRA